MEDVRMPSPKKRTPFSRLPSVTPQQAKMIFLPGQGCSGEHAFGSATSAHHHVDAGADNGGGNAGGQVAVTNQTNSGAHPANLFDHFFVARAVEDHDDEIFHAAIETLGDGLEVVGDRSIEVNGALAGGADNHFFHV